MIYRTSHLVTVFLILIASLAYGEEMLDKPRVLFPVEIDGKYGYINKTGQIIIAPEFDGASNFSEGIARILVGNYEDGAFGYIDTTGKVIIKAKFKGAGLFSEGVAIAEDDKGLGVINKSGNYITRLKSVKEDALIEGFSEGLAAVALSWKEKFGYYYGFIDHSGKVIIPAKYHFARNFSEGLAAVEVYGAGGKHFGLFGFIDKDDHLIIQPVYRKAKSFHQGLAAVYIGEARQEQKCGFIDRKGQWIVPAFFEECGNFSEGLASVKINKKYGYINQKGEVVIAPEFTDAEEVFGGLALVVKEGKEEDTELRGYINNAGSYIWGPKSYSTLP